ncbi:MAG TPA: MFS transporter [Verrucomicrobiae bacterium]|nr:MFS transporter [Verrucomicrobiae bacterium]
MATAHSDSDASSKTRGVFLYFTPLTLLIYLALPHQNLLDFTTSFMIKDLFHANAGQVLLFRLVTAVPIYFSFMFGLTRDMWNPLGMRDRGYFLIFGLISTVVFIWMAFSEISYARLIVGMILVMVTYRFLSAAYQGLMALVGQEKLMSGRLSTVWQIVSFIPMIAGTFASGWITLHLPPKQTFLIVTALSLLIAFYGFWKPKAVFEDAYNKPVAKTTDFVGDIKRLLKHKPIYPAVIIMFLFQFAPGSNTPLQFYLTDPHQVGASNDAYANFNGIFQTAFVPVFFLYGWLCKRVSLHKLLWWGMIITVPQYIPFLFIHSAKTALLMAVPIGLLGGIAGVAIYDLAIRSCPPGLQGTLMMMVEGVNLLSSRGGDYLGTAIYNKYADPKTYANPGKGFLLCVIAITLVYALNVLVLLMIPKEVTATADGERNPKLEAQTLKEIEATEPAK